MEVCILSDMEGVKKGSDTDEKALGTPRDQLPPRDPVSQGSVPTPSLVCPVDLPHWRLLGTY